MRVNTEGTDPRLLARLKLAGLIGGGLAIAVIAAGVIDRYFVNHAVAKWTMEQTIPTVTVVKPVAASGSNTLVLPGTLQAFYSAPIYARVPGYLHAWYKDIGAHVKKGEVLGVIDTPDLDQQIEQAKGDLANALAAQSISAITAKRWTSLLALDAVSKQEAEEKTSDLQAKTALATAAKANLDRLNALKSFARITAPFDGIVTSRSVDVGALVNAGASTTSPLFTVADLHQIRVYVSVPQNYSAEIHPGATATLRLPEYPGRSFEARLDTTANSISQQSNALLVEFLADNPDGLLKPGGYAQVSIHLATPHSVVSLPASALIFNNQGLQVATVSPNNRIVMKEIKIERDMGTTVEINAGLSAEDRVVNNPPDSISDGDAVEVQKANSGTGRP
ncbi:MAG TPA: efflux RND transporter periplasmic adaptor subunit [Rhizomicrobium sp.]|nr:efflux RND transporter periplasmic adaptor subunit [Rhizomicrobium sp.]